MTISNPTLAELALPTGLPNKGSSSTRTVDGTVVSVIFEDFKADSNSI
jgi:hypothetical protein